MYLGEQTISKLFSLGGWSKRTAKYIPLNFTYSAKPRDNILIGCESNNLDGTDEQQKETIYIEFIEHKFDTMNF